MTLSKLDEPGGSALDLSEDVELWKISSSCLEELTLNANKKISGFRWMVIPLLISRAIPS